MWGMTAHRRENPPLIPLYERGRQKAQEIFIPWVSQISQEHALPFNKVTISSTPALVWHFGI
jgi:hypothetical protein